jgi:hypothetical protein
MSSILLLGILWYVFNYRQFLIYNLILADEKVVNVDKCPMCGKSHPGLAIQLERNIIFRGPDVNMLWVVLVCPGTNEEFKVLIRRKT